MEKMADNLHHDTAALSFSLPNAQQRLAGEDQAATFVIGAPRSGTSLLYKVLCLHPNSSWISNYVRRAPRATAIGALSRLAESRPDARMQAWFGDGQAYRYGSQRKLSEWAFPSPVEGEPFFATCGFTADGSRSRLSRTEQKRRLLLNVRALCKAHGGEVFVSKRIAHNQRLPLLAEALPSARFIHLVRDGRSVAKSLRAVDWWPESYLPWYGGTPTDWETDGREPWEAAARHWVHELRDIEAGLAHVDSCRVLQLRYEDLLEAPVERVAELTTFAGLGLTPEMESVAGTLRPQSGPSVESAERAQIERIQQATLVAYGYECNA